MVAARGRPSAWLRLQGSTSLTKRLAAHGLTLTDVKLVASPAAGRLNERALLEMALDAHDVATRNAAFGNFSKNYIGATVRLASGMVRSATNIEQARDLNVCAERAAIVQAHQESLRALPARASEAEIARHRAGMAVETLVVVGEGMLGRELVCPCGECQSWLITERYYRPDTLIVGLRRDADGKLELHARRVDELLPRAFASDAPFTSRDVGELPIVVSPEATRALAAQPIDQARLAELIGRAQEHYRARTKHGARDTVAASLTVEGEIATGERCEFAARWSIPADQAALAAALRLSATPARVAAVAYFGETRGAPSPLSIGILARAHVGGPNTLIVSIEDGAVSVRALSEYCRGIFVSRDAPKAHLG